MGPTSSSSTAKFIPPPPQRCCRDFRGSGGVVGRCQTTGKLVVQGLKYHGSMPAMNTHTHRKQPSEMDLMSRSARLSTKCLRLKNKIVQSSSLQTNMHHLILKRLILTRIWTWCQSWSSTPLTSPLVAADIGFSGLSLGLAPGWPSHPIAPGKQGPLVARFNVEKKKLFEKRKNRGTSWRRFFANTWNDNPCATMWIATINGNIPKNETRNTSSNKKNGASDLRWNFALASLV